MFKDNSDNPFIKLLNLWLFLKKEAIETGDWSIYEEILKESKKMLSSFYASAKDEWYIPFLEKSIKIASCEIKDIIIKYKRKKVDLPF